MIDFDSVLKNSLKIVSEGYQGALSDVKDIVSEVSMAVARNGNEQFALYVQEMSSDIKGGSFKIRFDTNVNNGRAKVIDIVYVRIPSIGYPIGVGSFDKHSQRFFVDDELTDKESLRNYFLRLIENPESTLIQSIGYAMRKGEEDEEPF
jgi:hypothetical protein